MTTPDRIPCCVPFCRRTAARAKMPDASEIICGKHGRMAKRERALWRAVHKQVMRQGERVSERQWRRYNRVWDRFVAACTKAAADAPPPPTRKRTTSRTTLTKRSKAA